MNDGYCCLCQFLADHVECNPLIREGWHCQELLMEAMKYHLLPERRSSLQTCRTQVRKSVVGVLYAVGGMDCTKGKIDLNSDSLDFQSSLSLICYKMQSKCYLNNQTLDI